MSAALSVKTRQLGELPWLGLDTLGKWVCCKTGSQWGCPCAPLQTPARVAQLKGSSKRCHFTSCQGTTSCLLLSRCLKASVKCQGSSVQVAGERLSGCLMEARLNAIGAYAKETLTSPSLLISSPSVSCL